MNRGILTLQSEYLNGDEKALDLLYTELVKLGRTIIRCEHLHLETDVAYDMATSVVMRLRSLKEPIIKSAPSAFVKKSLYYSAHNIQKNHNYQCLEYPENYYTMDEYFAEETCDDFIFEILSNVQIPEDLMQMVSYCLYTQQTVKAVRVRIKDREEKKRFTKVMEDIHAYINHKEVCLSMLQWESYGWSQVLSETSAKRKPRKRAETTPGQVVTSKQGDPQLLLFSEVETTEVVKTATKPVVCKLRGRSNGGASYNPTPWLPGIVL